MSVRKGKRNNKDNRSKEESKHKDTRTKSWTKKDKTRANTRTKGEKERQTRNKPQNRLTSHAHKSPASHANHPSQANPHNNPKTL